MRPSVQSLCAMPYPNHPKGCPNFRHKAGCPPGVELFDRVYDLEAPVFVVYNVFDLAAHVAAMRERHPSWTERQLACCLYWQPRARKSLAEEAKRFAREHPGLRLDRCPEARGVDVTETMRLAGVELEWPPRNKAIQVILAASPKNDV